jgi:hypothetical protein
MAKKADSKKAAKKSKKGARRNDRTERKGLFSYVLPTMWEIVARTITRL